MIYMMSLEQVRAALEDWQYATAQDGVNPEQAKSVARTALALWEVASVLTPEKCQWIIEWADLWDKYFEQEVLKRPPGDEQERALETVRGRELQADMAKLRDALAALAPTEVSE